MESQTLSNHEPDPVVRPNFSAHQVADAFLTQYYEIMQNNPEHAHNFYKDESVRSHSCVDGSIKVVTTLQDISDDIIDSNIKKWNPDMDTMHAQDSLTDSVIVGVTGYLIDNDDVARNFAQTFFLGPQEGGGFYVHNDILQFIGIKNIPEASPSVDDVEDSLADQQADETAKDFSVETEQAANKDQTEKSTSTKDNDTEIKVSESAKGKKPLLAEPKKKQPSAWGPPPSIQEDSKKVSYASILAKEGSGPSTTQPSPNAATKVSPKTDKRASSSSVVPKPSMVPNGPSESIYDVKAIRVKDLPPKMTQESLLEVVKQFGPVKLKNIQIKEYSQDGYRYAFVEFDNPKSAHSAVEARFIRFDDRVSEIQYKIINNQGGNNNMGRPPYGRGGSKPETSWRRDGGEGRSSGSWGNKHVDHENFGQHSGQARDYNQRRNRYFQDRQ